MTSILDYRQEQETLRATLRQGMVAAANRLLTEEGAAALTVRRVAEAVNCSTTLLYSVFGGKDGLSNALYLEGFARLRTTFEVLEANLTPVQKNLACSASGFSLSTIIAMRAKIPPITK